MQISMKKIGLSQKILEPCYPAFLISFIYTLVGGMWVLLSEPVLSNLIVDVDVFRKAKIINQWLFIVVSAQLLFLLIRQRALIFIRTEETLHRVNRSLRVFSECHKAFTWERDECELLRKICRIMVILGGYRLAWVGYASDDEDKEVKQVAHWGYEDGYLSSLKVSWDETVYGQGPAGTSIRTGQTTVVQNITSNPQFRPWRQMALAQGFASAIALPLKNDNKVYGVLVILAAEPDAFSLEEVSHLEELADDLANRITNIRSEAEQKRVKQERLFLAKVIHQASEGALTFDSAASVQYINPAWENICGVKAKEVVGNRLHELPCIRRNESFYQAIRTVMATDKQITGHFLNYREDGSRYQVDARISPVRGENLEIVRYVAVIRDVSHEVELEEQLRTAQKMEAVATLAGGIAHDFNNILAAIINNAELALDDLPEPCAQRDYLEIVHQAGCRGKNLVKQIMTISRQDKQEHRAVSVEMIINECLKLLRATLPSTIELRKQIAPNLGQVPADPTQIHQVILNLCTNAADAMEEQGGILELKLEEVTLVSAGQGLQIGLHPGSYLKLTIRDSGHGMKPEILYRIFEPFFTTKAQGKGTGLGLSVAHSIIKNHGGHIAVESTPGQGSEFQIFLPRIYCIEEPEKLNDSLMMSVASEKILFVDDEPDLVFAGRKILEKLGYDVVACTDGRRALQLFMQQPAAFDLIITDQTMPQLTGEMLAREILKVRADVPIILCSGNAPAMNSNLSLVKARAIGIREFMAKPYDRREMSQVIRRLLD